MGNKIRMVRQVGGKVHVKLLGMAAEDWLIYDHPVDSLIDHARRAMGNPHLSTALICGAAGVAQSIISRCQRGEAVIPPTWILRFHDLTGVSIADLREVACMEPLVPAYRPFDRRRKHAPVTPRHNPQPLRPSGHLSES